MRIIAVIPARGGSKRVLRKNIKLCAGKPLIAYTCIAARESQHINSYVVSTDDSEIADISLQWGGTVPYVRPKELAEDATPMLPVLIDLLNFYNEKGEHYDILVLLQPTSPLRTSIHIDEAIKLFRSNACDSVVSVTECPHQFNPMKLMTEHEGFLNTYHDNAPKPGQTQTIPKVYGRNGPAIIVTKTDNLLCKTPSLYGEKIRPYIMDAKVSIDIDEPFDFEIAELLLERQNYYL
ncbi:acylneuraminate cytidylyltransferase family protein [Terasakiella sp. SH-1]|uniref:acylneuraminate cytidylyltransferase family protein n=1 Tax=Terasakiella sp. SH-1 TaxID=2560057 RepID=UPI0010744CBA|nr:acylneuraminate cytidylyltransferase family protein [Terasakiella sp. SH-1]